MTVRRVRKALRLQVVLVSILGVLSVGSTCVVVEEEGERPAYRDESAEGQMEDEEMDDLDRETNY
jgi:hypothetical protein